MPEEFYFILDDAGYEAAALWLAERNGMSYEDIETIRAGLADRAFWMARINSAELATATLESLDKAIDSGLSYFEWSTQVETALFSEWAGTVANPSARMRLIFTNWNMNGYNNARWEQMREPERLARRPMLKFDAVMDAHTSAICTSCDGVVRPHDDPWWETHRPQLHHACRSVVTSHSARREPPVSDARLAGTLAADKGFGTGEPWGGPKKSQVDAVTTPGDLEGEQEKAENAR